MRFSFCPTPEDRIEIAKQECCLTSSASPIRVIECCDRPKSLFVDRRSAMSSTHPMRPQISLNANKQTRKQTSSEADGQDQATASESVCVTSLDAYRLGKPTRPICPVCGGNLIDIRAKLQCSNAIEFVRPAARRSRLNKRLNDILQDFEPHSTFRKIIQLENLQTMRRRTFLCGSTLLIAGNQAFSEQASPSSLYSALSIGLLTDVHYADKKPNGSRHYRESLRKIEKQVISLIAKR